jgi:hypothetical protein
MKLNEQFFEDFRCIACDGKPFDATSSTFNHLFDIEDLVGECCADCGHCMSLEDLDAMTQAAEIYMIRSLFPPS